jgi:hypothetical protein
MLLKILCSRSLASLLHPEPRVEPTTAGCVRTCIFKLSHLRQTMRKSEGTDKQHQIVVCKLPCI